MARTREGRTVELVAVLKCEPLNLAKSVANVLAKRDLKKAAELMRMRSPLYQERVANPQMSVISPDVIAVRAAIARASLLAALHREDKR